MSMVVVTHWRVLKHVTGIDFEVGQPKRIGDFWFVRHPETALNAAGSLRGHLEIPLTSLGWEQAEQVAADLKDCGASSVYSSDLSRASNTANLIATACGIPYFISPLLRPADLGKLTGRPIEEVAHILDKIDAHGTHGKFPEGEAILDFRHRIDKVFAHLERINNA